MNSTTISNHLKCELRQSLHRIKVHTSNDKGSGTDANIILDLKVKRKGDDVTMDRCNGLFIDNHGNDRKRGQIDKYFHKEFGKLIK